MIPGHRVRRRTRRSDGKCNIQRAPHHGIQGGKSELTSIKADNGCSITLDAEHMWRILCLHSIQVHKWNKLAPGEGKSPGFQQGTLSVRWPGCAVGDSKEKRESNGHRFFIGQLSSPLEQSTLKPESIYQWDGHMRDNNTKRSCK